MCAQVYNICAHIKEVYVLTPRTGRPPVDNPKNERLFIRVTSSEKKEIQEFTKKSGLSLLDLIRIGMKTAEK